VIYSEIDCLLHAKLGKEGRADRY